MAVGSLVGSVALRPNTPLTATVIGTIIIVGMALLVDAAYAWGLIPASVVHARPLLLYADGEACYCAVVALQQLHLACPNSATASGLFPGWCKPCMQATRKAFTKLHASLQP